MKYIEFREALKMFTVFSLNEIKKIDDRFHRRRLNEWQDKGYIKKVIKGYYIFSDLQLNENTLFEIANTIHRPSYVSFEMALTYYHLIPEGVYAITSVSSRKPYSYSTPLGDFIYKKMKSNLFFGYSLVNYNDKCFKIANCEKALLDYFYIHPHFKSMSDFEDLRINADAFWDQIDEEGFHYSLQKFSQKTLTERMNTFLEYMRNA